MAFLPYSLSRPVNVEPYSIWELLLPNLILILLPIFGGLILRHTTSTRSTLDHLTVSAFTALLGWILSYSMLDVHDVGIPDGFGGPGGLGASWPCPSLQITLTIVSLLAFALLSPVYGAYLHRKTGKNTLYGNDESSYSDGRIDDDGKCLYCFNDPCTCDGGPGSGSRKMSPAEEQSDVPGFGWQAALMSGEME